MKRTSISGHRRTIVSGCLLFLLCSSYLTMRGQTHPALALSKYTISEGSLEVGDIRLVGGAGSNAEFKVIGKSSRNFEIKNNMLQLKSAGKAPKSGWRDVVLSATAGGKTISDTFRIVQDQFIRNKVIAHRGAWKNTRTSENSIAALNYAIEMGCEGSEFDVHMSADSVLFINHDPSISGFTIERTKASELLNVKLSNGENLPTLEAYLKEGLKQNKTKLILEIKPTSLGLERSRLVAGKVMELVRRLKAQAWVDYISFDYNICKELVRLDPYAHVAYLNGDKTPEELAGDKIWGLDYHFSAFQKNPNWFRDAQERKLTLNAWTVNDEKTMKWLLENKVDFITTNEPELLLKLITQKP